jgi:hypothetical protein
MLWYANEEDMLNRVVTGMNYGYITIDPNQKRASVE